jgi:TPR repeat protein
MANGSGLLKKALIEMERESPDLEKAFEFLNKSAEENNYEALYAIGTWYLHGRFVKKNFSLAIKYFLKSAEGNNSNAYYDLAICYEKGVIGKKDFKAAFECYLNAALLGDKQSIYEVGRCYYYGIGISKDIKIGNIWLKHAEMHGIKN